MPRDIEEAQDQLMTGSEVAALFKVHPDTVSRWDQEGRLPCSFRTAGGRRRWRRSEVLAAMGMANALRANQPALPLSAALAQLGDALAPVDAELAAWLTDPTEPDSQAMRDRLIAYLRGT